MKGRKEVENMNNFGRRTEKEESKGKDIRVSIATRKEKRRKRKIAQMDIYTMQRERKQVQWALISENELNQKLFIDRTQQQIP